MEEVDLSNTSNTISSNKAGPVTPEHYDLSPIGLIVVGLIVLALMFIQFLIFVKQDMYFGLGLIVMIYMIFMCALWVLGILLNNECKKAVLKKGDSNGSAK